MSTKVKNSVAVKETTSSMSSSLAFNIRVLKTPSGVLKFFEIIIGIICLSLFLNTTGYRPQNVNIAAGIVFLGTIPFLFITFLMFLSILISPMAANMLPKIIFEFLYHLFGFTFYLMSGLALLVLSAKHLTEGPVLEKSIALSVLCLINCVLYALSTHYSYKSYKEA